MADLGTQHHCIVAAFFRLAEACFQNKKLGNSGNQNAGGNATTGTTESTDTTTGGTTPTPGAVTGTIVVNEWLRIRSGPGTSYAVAGYLKPNDKVTITEQKTVGAITWGKIEKGWISMQYVKLDKTESGGATDIQPPAEDVRTVTATGLWIRKLPGTANEIVGYLYNGTRVTVLEIKTVNGRQWGRISNGWICLEYTKK